MASSGVASAEGVAAAMRRVEAVLQRRPEVGLSDDSPARSSWQGGLRVATQGPHGREVVTDLPAEIGGGGGQVSPGWLWRAALASCAVTRIVMEAATEGIVLDHLEARAESRSDTRGLLGFDGVSPGPQDVALHVRVGAAGVAADRLRALVQRGCACSPVGCAAGDALPVAVHIDVAGG